MTDKGLDYAFQHPSPASIKAAGYVFVSRYLSYVNPSTQAKVITPAEARDLLAAGLDIYLNWEFDAQDCLRGAAGGTADATEAVAQAKALGYPAGATIYHSADFDVTDAQKPIVAEYTTAARVVERAAGYRAGCYSGYYTIKYLFDHDAIDDGWQAYAWSAGQWDERAALRQVQNGINVGGADCDLDEKVGTAYSWLHPGGNGMTSPQWQELDDMAWRMDAIWADVANLRGGRFQNDPALNVNELHAHLAQIDQELANIKAALASTGGADHTHTVTVTGAGGTGPAQPLDPTP